MDMLGCLGGSITNEWDGCDRELKDAGNGRELLNVLETWSDQTLETLTTCGPCISLKDLGIFLT